MKTIAAVLLTAAALSIAPLFGVPALAQAVTSPTAHDARNDWDFLYGTWRTHYRILRHRLVNNHDWSSCEGTSVIRPFWQGDGNLEDGDFACPKRYSRSVTLRLYNRTTHKWSLWWGTRKLGLVPPPQVGEFDANGVGNFDAPDIQEGKHVIVRFRWTHVNGVPHFEQLFSTDHGATWETNWTTDYERVPSTSKGVWNATRERTTTRQTNVILRRMVSMMTR